MATISAKNENTLDFNFLKGTYGAGGGAGGGATSAGGAVGAIAGTVATIIGAATGQKTREELEEELAKMIANKWANSNNVDVSKNQAQNTTEATKTQQVNAIETWQQTQAQGIPKNISIPKNASITGTLPLQVEQIDMFPQGTTTIPKPKEFPIPSEQWAQQGTTLPAPGSLTGEQAGEVALPAPGSLTGEQAGEVALPAPENVPGTKTEEKTENKTNVTPVETTKKEYKSPNANIEKYEDWQHYYPNINNMQNYQEDNTKMEDYTQQINYNNLDDILARLKEEQLTQWEREDLIRKEIQEREDSAYQRAVADMRKAGVNPNLVGINPAESGGGITQATGMDYSMYTAVLNKELGLLEAQLNNAFKEDENTKDRIVSSFNNILQIAGWLAMITGGKQG